MIRCKIYYDYGRSSNEFNRVSLVLHVDATRINDVNKYIKNYVNTKLISESKRKVWGFDSLIISDVVCDNKCTLPYLVDQTEHMN